MRSFFSDSFIDRDHGATPNRSARPLNHASRLHSSRAHPPKHLNEGVFCVAHLPGHRAQFLQASRIKRKLRGASRRVLDGFQPRIHTCYRSRDGSRLPLRDSCLPAQHDIMLTKFLTSSSPAAVSSVSSSRTPRTRCASARRLQSTLPPCWSISPPKS